MAHRHPIRFGIQTWQQDASFAEIRDLWSRSDALGYDSLWVFDHFYPAFGSDPAGPCMEGWTLLSALSQHTRRARIGALVNGNTYRNPCLMAKMAATVDIMSGGRLNLGIGSGWFELEHRSFGIDFKTIPARLQALDESLRIIKGMFTREKTTLKGQHYEVIDAVCNPGPVTKPHPPILVGGHGQRTLLKIVARHADMWNSRGTAAEMERLIATIERHGDTVGRDTGEIEKTMMIAMCYRASKERERATQAIVGAMSGVAPEEAREQILIGGKQECLDTIERYVKIGVTHFIFMTMAPYRLDEVERFAQDIFPVVRAG